MVLKEEFSEYLNGDAKGVSKSVVNGGVSGKYEGDIWEIDGCGKCLE